MLIKFELNFQLPIIGISRLLNGVEEEVGDVLLDKQGTRQNPHDLHDWALKVEFVLQDSNEAIGDDSYVYLYLDGVFRFTPKCLDLQVLFDPLEEQFNLPSIAVKQRDVLGRKVEVVRIIGECPVQVWRKVHNAPDTARVVCQITFPREPDSLVSEYVVHAFKDVLTVLDFVFRIAFLSDDKERSGLVYCIKPCEVKVASIKYIARIRFKCKPIHCVDIMHSCAADSVEHRYLCSDVNLSVDLDTRFGASGPRPSMQRETQVNGSGIHGIESTMELKLLRDAHLLCDGNQIERVFLIDSVVPEGVRLGQHLPIDRHLAKTEEKRFLTMGNRYIREFSETVTTEYLTEYQNQHMVPMGERPTAGMVVVFVHYTPELALGKKRCDLCEDVLAYVHIWAELGSAAKIRISKPGQPFQRTLRCA